MQLLQHPSQSTELSTLMMVRAATFQMRESIRLQRHSWLDKSSPFFCGPLSRRLWPSCEIRFVEMHELSSYLIITGLPSTINWVHGRRSISWSWLFSDLIVLFCNSRLIKASFGACKFDMDYLHPWKAYPTFWGHSSGFGGLSRKQQFLASFEMPGLTQALSLRYVQVFA